MGEYVAGGNLVGKEPYFTFNSLCSGRGEWADQSGRSCRAVAFSTVDNELDS
jgi:hypothetical protein